jgi:hypothetical protein
VKTCPTYFSQHIIIAKHNSTSFFSEKRFQATLGSRIWLFIFRISDVDLRIIVNCWSVVRWHLQGNGCKLEIARFRFIHRENVTYVIQVVKLVKLEMLFRCSSLLACKLIIDCVRHFLTSHSKIGNLGVFNTTTAMFSTVLVNLSHHDTSTKFH